MPLPPPEHVLEDVEFVAALVAKADHDLVHAVDLAEAGPGRHLRRPRLVQAGPSSEMRLSWTPRARLRSRAGVSGYQAPVFSIDAQGSCGARLPPF